MIKRKNELKCFVFLVLTTLITGSNNISSSAGTESNTTGTFSVLSYNIGGLPEMFSSSGDPKKYIPQIGSKLYAYDLINVQEDFNYHASLYANDTHAYRTPTSGGAGIGDGMNFLSNYPFGDTDRETWTDRYGKFDSGSDELTPKGFMYNQVKIADGVYVDGMQEPQMKDALNYLKELYDTGVMDQEFITTENNTMREYVYTGKAASDIDYVMNYSNYILQSELAGKATDVQPIYMLKGPDGKGGGLNESIQTAWCISSECKNPEAAIRVIEALVTDPEIHAAFYNTGVEGKHYNIEDGIAVPTDKAANSGYSIKYNYLTDSFIKDFSTLKFQPDEKTQKVLRIQRDMIEKAMELKGDKQMIPSGISSLYDETSASITNTWKEVISQIVLSSTSIDEGLKTYKNFWDSVDGDTLLKELNAQ